MFLLALMISLILGTPSVTFIDATPAKWNVFSVIWVPGSPMDWAPNAPTVDPGSTIFSRWRLWHIMMKAFSCGAVNPTDLRSFSSFSSPRLA